MSAMRIMIVSDAWHPQVNGVVRTLDETVRQLRVLGHEVAMITPDQFTSFPCPTYPEIRLALSGWGAVGRRIAAFAPDAVHISTEGPLGLAARRWCLRHDFPFTTAYHTRFPEYVAARLPIPVAMMWRYVRWFHRPARRILAATPTLRRELADQGLGQVAHWGRGVDHRLFHPDRAGHAAFDSLTRPIQLCVGRVAVEKNIEAFLRADTPGTKVIVGDGPALASLRTAYPDTVFLGKLGGEALAAAYAGADVFVFPSLTDTFGLVMIEALSCGTPVASFPVAGPIDIICDGAGVMDRDLGVAIGKALPCSRAAAADVGARHSWEDSTQQFLQALAPVNAAAVPDDDDHEVLVPLAKAA